MKKTIFILLTVLFCLYSRTVYCESYTHISGEDGFNKTTDEIMSGNFNLSPEEIIKKFTDSLFNEIRNSRSELVGIIIIAALSGILQSLKTSAESGINETAFFACFVVIALSALKIFSNTVSYGVNVVQALTDFITKLAPVFTALLVSCGAISSAAAFHPILSAAVFVLAWLVENCIVPLIYFSAVLGIVSHLTPRLQIKTFTALIRSTGKWILTAALTIFGGITAIYGFTAPVMDAVALKGIKFTVASFVPVVGGLLTETVETVLSGTQLMKNTVGTAGIITLISICTVPIIKIFAIRIMLELCSAAAEPLSDKRITDMLKDISASISLVLATVFTTSMLFIICIGIIMGATA